MTTSPITIHTFGGAALADLTAFRHTAGVVVFCSGQNPAFVVSAMRGVTDARRTAATVTPPKVRTALTMFDDRHRAVTIGVASDCSRRAELRATITSVFAEPPTVCTRRRTGPRGGALQDMVASRDEVLASLRMVKVTAADVFTDVQTLAQQPRWWVCS